MNTTVEAHRLCSVCQDMIRKSQLLKVDSLECEDSEPPSDDIKVRQKAIFIRFEERAQLQYDAEYFVHHASKLTLERSAAGGCHLCSLAVSCRWKPFLGKSSKYSSEFAKDFLDKKFNSDGLEVSNPRELGDDASPGEETCNVNAQNSEGSIFSGSTDIQCAIYRQKRDSFYSIGYVDSQTDTEADGLIISLQGLLSV